MLDDVLSGGFGTPEDGFSLRWKNVAPSRERLGYPETVRQLNLILDRCHPSGRASTLDEIRKAQRCEGPTVFDWLIELIRDHGASGQQAEDQVELILD